MLAKQFALNVHANDLWGTAPYSTHLALVVDAARKLTDNNKSVNVERVTDISWLHDCLEDHPEFDYEIRNQFKQYTDTLSLLTRKHGETYVDYIQRIYDSENPEAVIVKVADLSANEETAPESLRKRYKDALQKLTPLLT